LDVSKSYLSSNIDQKILKLILEQSDGSDEQAIFRNLTISKNKKAGEWIEDKLKKIRNEKKIHLGGSTKLLKKQNCLKMKKYSSNNNLKNCVTK